MWENEEGERALVDLEVFLPNLHNIQVKYPDTHDKSIKSFYIYPKGKMTGAC